MRQIAGLLEAIRELETWHRDTMSARERLDRRLWMNGYLAVVLYFAVASLVQRHSRGNTHKGFVADEYVLVAFLACVPTTDTAHSSSISGDSDGQHLLSFDPEAWARRLPWPNNNNSRWTTSGFRPLGSTIYIIAQTPSYRVLTLGDGMHLLAFPCEADAATLLEHLGERISHDGAFVEARPAASLSGTIRRLSKDHAVCKDDIQDLCWWAMRRGKRAKLAPLMAEVFEGKRLVNHIDIVKKKWQKGYTFYMFDDLQTLYVQQHIYVKDSIREVLKRSSTRRQARSGRIEVNDACCICTDGDFTREALAPRLRMPCPEELELMTTTQPVVHAIITSDTDVGMHTLEDAFERMASGGDRDEPEPEGDQQEGDADVQTPIGLGEH
ncbi:g9193 [Coccomyxa viridis]|uniref:G9193 protein n=1 Tax=Coccomyxa viridis TaxID=1274662 RepID=A0ABP1G4P5_9CHLO